jgi:IclR family mhp operon transcriptional activator
MLSQDGEFDPAPQYGPIRSLSRSIAVLQAVNKGGSVTVAEIAESTDLPYPTVYRFVHALMHEGLIERDPGLKLYRPTALVQSLASGYQDHGPLLEIARPLLIEFTLQTKWPVVIATQLGKGMIIRDTTHALTGMSLGSYQPGFVFPFLDSAAGRVCLAYLCEKERHKCLDGIEATEGAQDGLVFDAFRTGVLADNIRAKGYAIRHRNRFAAPTGKNSSIAAPILKDGQFLASIAMVFMSNAMKVDDAEARYANKLTSIAREITAILSGADVRGAIFN